MPQGGGPLRAYQELPSPLKVFLTFVSALTFLSLFCAFAARHAGLPLPYSSAYYFHSYDTFRDFQGFRDRFHLFLTPAFFLRLKGEYVMYPAPLMFPIALFFKLTHPIRGYLAFVFATTSIASVAFFRALRNAGLSTQASALFVTAVLTTSYPLLFLLQRGNLELVAWVPLAIGLWCFYKEKFYYAAMAFALAATFKIYPFMFLSLLLARRQYKALALGIATGAAITLTSFWALGPSIAEAYRWNSVQLNAFATVYAGAHWGLGYDHSFFGLLKFFTLPWQPDLAFFVRPYSLTMACLGVMIYFGRLWRLPTLNQILALSILSITIPPVSYDYTLMSLYPVFAMICLETLQTRESSAGRSRFSLHFVLLALILTPENYLVVGGNPFGAQLRCVCLATLLFLALTRPVGAAPQQSRKMEHLAIHVSA